VEALVLPAFATVAVVHLLWLLKKYKFKILQYTKAPFGVLFSFIGVMLCFVVILTNQ
jgi:hypothetical protein